MVCDPLGLEEQEIEGNDAIFLQCQLSALLGAATSMVSPCAAGIRTETEKFAKKNSQTPPAVGCHGLVHGVLSRNYYTITPRHHFV